MLFSTDQPLPFQMKTSNSCSRKQIPRISSIDSWLRVMRRVKM
jgi:hypothetical protein